MKWLVENGQYSLGVYLLHMFVMDFLTPLNPYLWHSAVWQLTVPFLTMGISLALVKYLMRFSLCRKVLG